MGEIENTRERMQEWRFAVARLYLTGILTVIPAVLVIMLIGRGSVHIDPALLFVFGTWATFGATRLFAPRAVQASAVIVLLMATGAAGPLVLGLSPGPFLSGASGVLLGGVIFGRRASLALLLVFVVIILVDGALITSGLGVTIDRAPTDPEVLANWIRLALFAALTIGLLLFVLTGLFERMEAAWRSTAEAAERERQEHEQRRVAEERAVEAQRLESIGRLAGGVAHDFNNLLVVIMGWADLLPNLNNEAHRKEGLEAITRASSQAAQLTRQLLSFARKSVVQPAAVDVDAFLVITLRSLRRMVPDDIKIDHTPNKVPRALVDETQLGQVLLNLVINASDAMPDGGTVTLRSALLAPPDLPSEAPDRAAGYVAVTVGDTGVGMDEATRARIFEPFFTTKGPSKGSGLGLASVYGIVTQAKGFVRVESTPGLGSRFTVAFPVAPESAAAPDVATQAAGAPAALTARVLLVEDNTQVRNTMATVLRGAGLELLEAGTAAEALAAARRQRDRVDLLCTDAVMPGIPTQQLISGFRELFPDAPVLVCSGYVEEELVRRGIEERSVEVLPKPFTAEQLLTKVRELLGDKAVR